MATLARPAQQLHFPFIPSEISQPLIQIAQLGYDVDLISQWYSSIKRDLLQIDASQVSMPYAITPPFSICSPAYDPSNRLLGGEDTYSVRDPNVEDCYITPSADVRYWCNTPQTYTSSSEDHTDITTSRSLPPPVTVDASDHEASWQPRSPLSPRSPYLPERGSVTHPISAGVPEQQVGFINDHTPRYRRNTVNNHDTINNHDSVSRKRRSSHSPAYQVTMSSTAMPLLVPSEPSTLVNSLPYGSLTTSTEVTYLPPISIIPSRKRRRTSHKGAQQFIQPLQLQRQTIS